MNLAFARGIPSRSAWSALTFGMITVLVIFLVLYPMGWLLYGSFRGASPFQPGNLTLANYASAYSDPDLPKTILTTLLFSLGQTIIALTFGAGLAWVVARTNTPCRRLFEFLTLVLFLLPSIVTVVAWTLLLSPTRGLLNDLLHLVLPWAPTFDVYGLGSMIFIQGLSATPFAYLIIAPILASTDVTLEEAARMAGSSQLQTLCRITLPVARPALASAAILLFITGIEAFDVPQLLGAPRGIYTFTSLIFYAVQVRQPAEWGVAAALATSLQLVSLMCIFLYRHVARVSSRYETIKGRGHRVGIVDLGSARWITFSVCASFFGLSVALPFIVTLVVSGVPFFFGFSYEILDHLTWGNYQRLFHHPALVHGLVNSAVLAVFGAAICVFLSAVISFLVAKRRGWALNLLENISMLPIAVPATVLAIGLLWAWITIPLPIYGTLAILAIAYITRYIPLGMRSIIAGLTQIGSELEEASTISGAARFTTLRRIILPIAAATLLAAWILLFMVFFREFSMSILLSGPGNPVLSVVLYDYYESAEIGPLCAASLILAVVTMTTVGFAQWVSRLGAASRRRASS